MKRDSWENSVQFLELKVVKLFQLIESTMPFIECHKKVYDVHRNLLHKLFAELIHVHFHFFFLEINYLQLFLYFQYELIFDIWKLFLNHLENDVSDLIYEIGGFTELNFFTILNKCGGGIEWRYNDNRARILRKINALNCHFHQKKRYWIKIFN